MLAPGWAVDRIHARQALDRGACAVRRCTGRQFARRRSSPPGRSPHHWRRTSVRRFFCATSV